jgi:hypothetical protein
VFRVVFEVFDSKVVQQEVFQQKEPDFAWGQPLIRTSHRLILYAEQTI